ncbi:glycosyltransferase 87 family protein [Streptomyces sp. ITFR-21]|nr:glycosyltransferase 87 family protein [Streptomyces sp. ITFR-21]WNI15166.1 glycosyltransferase 87 family protein [Streptomyces sp. ITFR-21]
MKSTHNGHLGRAVALWALTRAALLLFVFQVARFPGQVILHDVSDVYEGWYPVLRAGAFPAHDVTWQYPPGAAAVMVAPGAVPFLGYPQAFFCLALLADAVVTGALLGDARRSGRTAGVWAWVVGVALGGPIVYARYDVMVTAVGVLALLLLRRRPAVAGVLAGVGALLKVWPVLLLIGVPRGRPARRAWLSAGATVAAGAALFAATMPGAFSFLASQRDRGTEVESLGAMVFHVGRHFGWRGRSEMHYGSVEFLGPYVRLVSAAALGLSVLAFCWLVWWRLRARTYRPSTPYDAAFAALLLFTTTSRVISPQYMVWLVGAGALCVTLGGTVQRLPVLLTLAATFCTTLEFPVFFSQVTAGDVWGVLLLGLRNGLLVAASLIACRRLWTATVPARGARTRDRTPAADAAPVLTPP